MIKNLLTALYTDDDMLFFNEDSDDFIVFCNERGILSVYHNKINLDDINYDVDDVDAIIHIRLLAWQIKF